MNYQLFSEKMRDSLPSPLYNFVERYLFQLKAISNKSLANEKMGIDKFRIEYGSIESISLLHDTLDVRIATDTNKRYNITWSKEDRTIMSISFPIQYELILGLKKTDIENSLKERLQSYSPHSTSYTIDERSLTATIQKDFFIERKGIYQIESMRADHYYIKNKSGYSLLADANNPIESLANLVTTGQVDNNIKLTIIQKKYGNKQDTIHSTLNTWISFCQEEGCIPYFGIEAYDGTNIHANVIMENKALGYVHLFFFTSPVEYINDRNGNINATLYSYIPMHNLNNLFDDYSIRLKKHTPRYKF